MTTKAGGKSGKNVSLSALLRRLENVPYFRVEWIMGNIPFILFLMILCFIYIWNNHKGVVMVKEIRTTEERMTEAMWKYNSSKNDLTRNSRQSTVAERVSEQQMYELTNPPYTIIEE